MIIIRSHLGFTLASCRGINRSKQNVKQSGETKIGEDAFGNTYFQEKKETYDGRKRRWVKYDGYADASRVPPGWQGWLNHTSALPPTEDGYAPHDWELEHQPNLTGTVHAYKPKGSLDRGGVRDKVAADYEAWTPDA